MASAYRKFLVPSVVEESETAKSFLLTPLDGAPLTPYLPGQHLPLRLPIPGQSRPVIRCYTLSDCFDPHHYRLTIKKELPPRDRPEAPAGLSSTYFHEGLCVGDVIEAKDPSGNFYLDPSQTHPVVLLAGGIGVTPMISMINALASSGSRREVYFFFALRHGGDHVFKQHLSSIAAGHPNIRVQVLYETPRPHDVLGVDYDRVGRMDCALLRAILPSMEMEYFVCGPPGMMQAICAALTEEGVAPGKIRTESFGPSSLAFRSAVAAEEDANAAVAARSGAEPGTELTVTFAKSGKTVLWTVEAKTLLELAEMHGIDISFGCRYGDCGTCLTRLLRSTVRYLHTMDVRPDPGTCLPCSCRPETSVELEA